MNTEVLEIRSTAYSHSEADHLKYGRKNAIGSRLKYGQTRSAVADWSRYPLGTKFKIVGNEDTLYIVDDYGSALVGEDVIYLYKPTLRQMRQWGVCHVEVEIIE